MNTKYLTRKVTIDRAGLSRLLARTLRRLRSMIGGLEELQEAS